MGALSIEVNLVERDGRVFATSREIAERFGKRHDSVLRSIRELECSAEFQAHNFVEQEYSNERGHKHPMYEITRDGFSFLVMGFTGKEAAYWKERFIEAFNRMEAALQQTPVIAGDIDRKLAQLVEISANTASSIGGLYDGQNRVEKKVDRLDERVTSIEVEHARRRKSIRATVKAQHIADLRAMGGRCPCCSEAEVVTDNGEKNDFAEFDHFYQSSKADAEHTWLICKPCHSGLTYGRVPRPEREREFGAYQDKRRRLPGRQPRITGL